MLNISRIILIILLIPFIGQCKDYSKDFHNVKELGKIFLKSDIENKYKSAMKVTQALDSYVHTGISVSLADLFNYLGSPDMYINYSPNQSEYGYIFDVIHEKKITKWVLYFTFKNSKLVLAGDNAFENNDHSRWIKVKKNKK